MYIVAVSGISGIGKTKILSDLIYSYTFQYLSSSELIKSGKNNLKCQSNRQDTYEQSIYDNQYHLIEQFFKNRDLSARCIVLDCHTVIDTLNGFIKISPWVFERIGVSCLITLIDGPSQIFLRRKNDLTRQRPNRTKEYLDKYQNESLIQALIITTKIGVPLNIIPVQNSDELKNFV